MCSARRSVSIALLLQGCAVMFSPRRPPPWLLTSFFSFLPLLLTATVTRIGAAAPIEVLSHDVRVDPDGRRTTFTLTFDRPPDFYTLSDLGRPAHAFQYFYDAQASADGEVDFTGDDVVIIRGPEIHVAGVLPIRDSLNPSGEQFPDAEGWGKKLGEVDFELAGSVLTFTAPWDLLRESNGVEFGYHLFTFQSGELTGQATFVHRILVPLPPALVPGGALLAASLIRRRI